METVNIVGSALGPRKAIGLWGARTNEHPKSFHWTFETSNELAFFTDSDVHQVETHPAKNKVILLVEPSFYTTKAHVLVSERYGKQVNAVLSPDAEYVHSLRMRGINAHWYPFGGSMIKPEHQSPNTPKTKFCSLITSHKTELPGHQARAKIAELIRVLAKDHKWLAEVDIFEGDANQSIDKLVATAPYRFQIVIENGRQKGWFTEKIIDPISVGTIPIYWGCENIGNFFFDTHDYIFDVDEPYKIIYALEHAYDMQHEYCTLEEKRYAFELAQAYQCAEDWIFSHLWDEIT